MLINSRPSFNKPGSILIHLREMDGVPGAMTISSAITGRPVRRMVEVNVIGEEIGQPMESVKLNPFEVKFIQIEY